MQTRAMIAYSGRGVPRPRYYANDHRRDVLDIVPVEMGVADARARAMRLDQAGFALIQHESAVTDLPTARRLKPATARRSSRSSQPSAARISYWSTVRAFGVSASDRLSRGSSITPVQRALRMWM